MTSVSNFPIQTSFDHHLNPIQMYSAHPISNEATVLEKIEKLRITINDANRKISILQRQHLMTCVAVQFGVTILDIMSPTRRPAVVRARFAYCLYRWNQNTKLTAIGAEVCRDHSTVLHAIRKAKALLISDSEFLFNYNKIKRDYEA